MFIQPHGVQSSGIDLSLALMALHLERLVNDGCSIYFTLRQKPGGEYTLQIGEREFQFPFDWYDFHPRDAVNSFVRGTLRYLKRDDLIAEFQELK